MKHVASCRRASAQRPDSIEIFPTLQIDPSREKRLLSTLRKRGYEVIRDDDLIRQINSYA